jgi:hypothetical protein
LNFSVNFAPKDIQNIVGKTIEAINKARDTASYHVAERVIKDTLTVSPTPPIDTGHLRGAHSIMQNSKVLFENPGVGGQTLPPDSNLFTKGETRVGFNAPYAFVQHEGISDKGTVLTLGRKNDKKVGRKFLSSKLTRFAKKYKELWQAFFNEALE